MFVTGPLIVLHILNTRKGLGSTNDILLFYNIGLGLLIKRVSGMGKYIHIYIGLPVIII